ncbi:MAG: hypothetical protein KA250_05305 [Verrucomicrobiales bacterium]|jgi:hypothetical protein|nr:hypothetical protein [Verrucomicrobiales bacterium]MBP9222951.1 hypothetical protein [Verrucomicrobiales bacterium]HQZ28049.1 hypothetical protein [Verrucomicrobiales bacterium]
MMSSEFRFHALYLLVSAFLLSSCFDSSSDSTAEDPEDVAYQAEKSERDATRAKVTELKAEKKSLEAEIKSHKSASSRKDTLAKEEIDALAKLEATRQYATKLDGLAKAVDASLSAWREATRNSFKGVQLPEIVTVGGKTYSGVTINGVLDDTIVIEHSGGMETVPVSELPIGLRRNIIHEATVLTEKDL